MSETPPPPNQNPGVVQAGVTLGTTAIKALPSQFLTLILVNLLFVGVLFWFVDARARHTAQIMDQLLERCLDKRS